MITPTEFVELFESQRAPTETLFRTVTAEMLSWKATERSFTTSQLMVHMAGAASVYARGIANADWGFTSMREVLVRNRHTPEASVEEAVQLLHTGFDDMRTLVSALSEEAFEQEVTAPQFGKPTPRWRVALFGFEHHVTHKAELFMYMKMQGANVHTGTLYRG